MKFYYLISILFILTFDCKAQKLEIEFYNSQKNLVLTLNKKIDVDTKCFSFTESEKELINKYDLSDGELIILIDKSPKQKFSIINVYTSMIYSGEILLCDKNGKMKYDEPICFE